MAACDSTVVEWRISATSVSMQLVAATREGRRAVVPCEKHANRARPADLKTGVVSQAAGSCYAEFGATKVMVAVYGPRQGDRRAGYSEQGRINCDVKLATFATRQRGKLGQVRFRRQRAPCRQRHAQGGLGPCSSGHCATVPCSGVVGGGAGALGNHAGRAGASGAAAGLPQGGAGRVLHRS